MSSSRYRSRRIDEEAVESSEQLLMKSPTQQRTDNDYVYGQVNTESVNRYLPYPTTPHQPFWECEKKAERLACLVALANGAAQKLLIAAQRSSCQSCMTSCMIRPRGWRRSDHYARSADADVGRVVVGG
jgi:hypothetical protein